MSADTYIPRDGSVAMKVIAFLAGAPDEQLDADLISAKYDCGRNSVRTLLGPSVQAGYLDRTEDLSSGELVYSLGKVALPTSAAGGFKGWLERKGQQSAEGRPARAPKPDAGTPPPAPAGKPARAPAAPFSVDLSTVAIESGIPLPAGKAPTIDWPSLFDRLQLGDSFQLPAEARSAVGSAATKYRKATGKALSLRRLASGIRVWRVE